MSRVALVAAALLLYAAPATATPVVDVLTDSDGNFSFSVVHSSTGGSDGQSGSILDSISLGGGGGSANVSGGGTQLDLNVQLDIGGGTYNASGTFDLAGLLDNSAQLDVLLGTLSLTHLSGTADYDGLTFYFEDRNYSSATSPPNSLDGVFLSLWGATAYTIAGPNPAIGDAIDLTPGGTGIDLRLELANPIPEPSALLAFVTGLLTVELTRGSKGQRRA